MWLVVVAALVFLSRKEAMAYEIKNGVFGTIRNEMKPALDAVQQVWAANGLGIPVVTSIEDGRHMSTSKHHEGLAHDYRLKTVPLGMHVPLTLEVARILGNDFDVIHEGHGTGNDHLHIEFDPKGVV